MPTHDTEKLQRHDPAWTYGFHEPDETKIPKDKLTLREALEVHSNRIIFRVQLLRARQELDEMSSVLPRVNQADAAAVEARMKHRESVRDTLETMPATKRVDTSLVDTMYKYFRPFVRTESQQVCLIISNDIQSGGGCP